MRWWQDQKALHSQMGRGRFVLFYCAIFAVVAAYGGAIFWLSREVGWPESYGFSCSGKCVVVYLWHSPALLQGANLSAIALFVLIWLIPTVTGVLVAFITIKRKLRRRREGIRPMRE